MKKSRRIAQGVAATALVLGFGFVAAAYAHPGAPSGMEGMHGMGPGMMHGGSGGPMAAQQLMTPEERQAFIEKMRNAKTAEERQKLAQANHAEIEKRAKEKGITLPEAHGPHAGFGPHLAPPSAAPTR
jgi:hypothetical protein